MPCGRADTPLLLRNRGRAVEFMINLLSSCLCLPPDAPLATFSPARVESSIWTQARTTAAHRLVVALAGLPADEHSLQIGGGTFLSAGGASVDVVQREGR